VRRFLSVLSFIPPWALAWVVLLVSLLRVAGAPVAAPTNAPVLAPTARGEEVAVVYNTRVPESQAVAEHYARRREVPAAQVFGLALPTTETITRREYVEQLEKPLLQKLEAARLFTIASATPTNSVASREPIRRLVSARIRYVVLCYGVPARILKDPTLVEEVPASLPPELRRNEAAVDAQLAVAPVIDRPLPWTGPLASPFFGITNAAGLHPTNGILMVTRLDGPSAAIARRLVDQAIEAETNGWWGRAYFDARGLGTNDPYRLGDDLMRGAALVAREYGFETELDEKPETFSAGYPMSQVALYMGWYDQVVTGPFTRPTVEFMPGAFAYHLYSWSAGTLRSTNSWVGTLLEKGATCTMGAVDEPYLHGTPNVAAFLQRFTFGRFTFGEAAYAAQGALSWQTTVIGDPLYRPCGSDLRTLHQQLEQRQSKLLEWSHLLVVNRNAAIGTPPRQLTAYIESFPFYRQSAVLTEKLGDLFWELGSMADGADGAETALKRGPSPQQRIRLLLKCGERRSIYGREPQAYGYYETLLKENPNYPDALKVYQLMLPLARRMNNPAEVTRCETEIKKRTSPQPPASGRAQGTNPGK
jgi:uncharacterized protein (TIGR03790 family)